MKLINHLGETFELRIEKYHLELSEIEIKLFNSDWLDTEIKINNKDLAILKSIFDKNIYDFSGRNSFTESIYNYYESNHFRPIVGDSILKIIYQKNIQ